MTVWLTGENGALLGFSEPLPPAIAAQLARGVLRPAEPPEALTVPLTVPFVIDAAAMAGRVAAGVAEIDALRQGTREPAEPPEPEPAHRPSVRASAGQWRAYAISQGMPKGRADAMTKKMLIDEYTRLRAVS